MMTMDDGRWTIDDGRSTMDDSPLLQISGLTVRPAHEALLSNLSFTVGRGTLHALVGPNGAGKTTLLSAILGLIPFTGHIVAHWARNGRIGYVPQQFHVDRTLPVTVADFLALTRQVRPVCLGVTPTTGKRISLLLERVGLKGFDPRPLSVLSGGELRRVLLANALDPLPELLILDEPAASLDEAGSRWLDQTLVALKGDLTILMVSHDSEQVRRIADSITVLSRAEADLSAEVRPPSANSGETSPSAAVGESPANSGETAPKLREGGKPGEGGKVGTTTEVGV
jgi:zinc transport system ATP-binding protein